LPAKALKEAVMAKRGGGARKAKKAAPARKAAKKAAPARKAAAKKGAKRRR
jgi:hypothetical protein